MFCKPDVAITHAGLFLDDVLPLGLCAIRFALPGIQVCLGNVGMDVPGRQFECPFNIFRGSSSVVLA